MAKITHAELDRLKSKIGQRVTVSEPPYLTEVTRDAIRHWARATGDHNPLFQDEEYALCSVHKGLIAPPTILYAFSTLSIGYRGGLPGVHSMFAGTSWHWHRPIRLGERISLEVTFKDLVELPSTFARRMFKQISTIRYLDGEGKELANAESWGMRTERTTAKDTGKYNYLKPASYSEEELARIAELFEQERCRGAETLFWEDVKVGDEIPVVVRGPYSATNAVAFEQAWGGLFILAHGFWFNFISKHPNASIRNSQGVPEPPEAVHWDRELARSVGVPDAYDYGPERISWLANMMTNWIGDEGFLSDLYVEIRRFNLMGDLSYCHGRVVEKNVGTERVGSVRLDVWITDQRDETTAQGRATVQLVHR
jgi:acyl dehydratase